MLIRSLIALVLSGALLSCVKDKPLPAVNAPLAVSSSSRVLVINEGNYGSANASISAISRTEFDVTDDVYRGMNGEALGDVAQSLSLINGQYYLVVNNSGKIVVCDRELRKKQSLQGFDSPRYLLQVSPSKAYVSELRSGKIEILNLTSGSISGTIRCPGWTEQMQVLYGKAYVCNPRRSFLYVIDVASDQLKDSISLPAPAGSMVTDNQDKLWLICSDGKSAASLVKVDPVSGKKDKSIVLSAISAFALTCNGRRDSLYFLAGGIFRFVPAFDAAPIEMVPAGSSNFYGLGIDPFNGDIYAADAIDYSQRSQVSIFSAKGERKKLLRTGINSSGFYFE